jgi:hypothetical protein
MARVPVPERGQPLDLSYVYLLAEAINDLSAQLSPSNNRYVTVETPADGKQSTLSSGVKINAATVQVATSSSVLSGTEQEWSYSFPAEYKFAPVATATAINTGGTPAGREVSVILKSVTTTRVSGVVKYNASGDLTIGVNLIVVGIPN